ncbi:MAG: hypothetical protein NZ959_06465 [Armatimonadetes bacterium]|nr:hypothetical protein [Armatimonadota bacterium]MDW8122014.1 hypothetical protein [Armatimonadota bacterium]
MAESREQRERKETENRTEAFLPYFVLVRLGPLKPYGGWFLWKTEDGSFVRARKLLPETVQILGRVVISEENAVSFQPETDDAEVAKEGKEFVQRCEQEPDPFVYAIARAAEPLDDCPRLRWLEVNPIVKSLVVHTLLLELETGQRIIVGAHQVPWESGS